MNVTSAQPGIGRYVLLDEIGRGGTGVVHRAHDPAIGRTVAIKILHAAPGLTSQQLGSVRGRFTHEARTAGSLDHPNIVRIFDVGEDENGRLYIVMEYVSEGSLEQVATSRTLGIEEIAALLAQIASALDAAHAQGVIHRDVKPANILMTADGTPKIVDFGVAQMANAHLTQDMRYLGTPATMAPEQVEGKSLDATADLFSLGVLCYRLLTGRFPFEGADAISMAYQIVHSTPRAVSAANPALPQSLDRVMERMLAKDPSERYASGREFHEAFVACLSHAAPNAGKTTPVPAKSPNRLAVFMIGALFFVAFAFLAPVWRSGPEPAAPQPLAPPSHSRGETPASDQARNADAPSAAHAGKGSSRAPESATSRPARLPAAAERTQPAVTKPRRTSPMPPAQVPLAVVPPAPSLDQVPPAPASAAVEPKAPARPLAPAAEATIAIRHSLSHGTLTVFVDGKPILSDAFSKKKWVPSHVTQWSGIPVPGGEHEVTAEVIGEEGKIYRSESFTIGFGDGNVTALRFSFKDDALVLKRK